jgi:translocator assembly and maintenance protein 41
MRVGDFRMYVGEDKNKVSNIVKPNVATFRALYEPHLRDMATLSMDGITKTVRFHAQ